MSKFEVRFDCPTKTIITDILIRRAVSNGGVTPHSAPLADISVSALWDTGATRSVISENLAKRLVLFPVGSGAITGIGGTIISNRYDVSLMLPSKVIFPIVCVAEWPGHPRYDMLIGMDIISRGKFIIDNDTGKTVFTFKA